MNEFYHKNIQFFMKQGYNLPRNTKNFLNYLIKIGKK